MANSKTAPSKPRRKTGSASSGGSAGSALPGRPAPRSKRTSNRSAKAPSRPRDDRPAKAPSRPRSSSGTRPSLPSTRKGAADGIKGAGSTAGRRVGQAAGAAKQAAAKARGPALAVGAAAAGVAGARALRGRIGRKTVLGVPIPTSLKGASLPDLDVRSIAKTIGEASQRFAETSKAVSKDLERAGNQAERIGRMLG